MVDTGQFLVTTAKLLPDWRRNGNLASLASAYTHEADPDLAILGDLACVVEVLAPDKQAKEVIDLITTTATKTYYDEAKGNATVRFEAAVKAVNEELAIYATHGNNAWVGKVSAVLAAVAGNEVHVTQAGSAQGYLYRDGKSSCITTGLASKEPHRPSKTFTNIASGELLSGDRILLTTPALLHQLSTEEVTGIIGRSSAPQATAKLQELLATKDNLERIAATITEVSALDDAAMVPQSGLPTEARLGKPESFADLARGNTAPLLSKASSALGSGMASLRRFYSERFAPTIRRSTLATVKWLRRVLAMRRGRWIFLAVSSVIIILMIFGLRQLSSNRALAALAKEYQSALQKENMAAEQLANGDKLGAKGNYQSALDQLNQILSNPDSKGLDGYLAAHKSSEDDPGSASKLREIITTQLDQIDGLTKVNPGQVADFSALSNAHPTLMTSVSGQLLFVDPQAGSSIYRYDISRAKLEVVANHPTKLGRVVAMGASSNGDGVFLLTDQPAVWFYKLDDSSLTAQTSGDAWPKGKAIASYAGNLYILTDSGLFKLTRTAGGYSAKAAYPINDSSVLAASGPMAIDGNIYIGNDHGFSRILAGVVQKTDLSFPANLSNPRSIISTSEGKQIMTVDAKSSRLGLFSFDGATLQYTGQLSINGGGSVYGVAPSGQDKTLYALVDQKLVKISY